MRVLTHTQNASAAVFSAFMGIHLAAPIAASVGGIAAADGVMVSLDGGLVWGIMGFLMPSLLPPHASMSLPC